MKIRAVPRVFVLIVGGIVAIIVGFFMLRGTMRLWDKPTESQKDEKDGEGQ